VIKSELIDTLATENPHLTHAEVERVVNIVLGRMTAALSEGGRVELRGFGAFSGPRQGRAAAHRADAAARNSQERRMRGVA